MAIINNQLGDRALVSTGRRGSFRSSQGSESRTDTFKLQWLTIQSSGRRRATPAPRSIQWHNRTGSGQSRPARCYPPSLGPATRGLSFWLFGARGADSDWPARAARVVLNYLQICPLSSVAKRNPVSYLYNRRAGTVVWMPHARAYRNRCIGRGYFGPTLQSTRSGSNYCIPTGHRCHRLRFSWGPHMVGWRRDVRNRGISTIGLLCCEPSTNVVAW
jgi:hypothetical protein